MSAPLRAAGVWTAIVTPFRGPEGEEIDWEALDRLVDAQVAAGVDAVVPCGTTGESPTLTHAEHDRVVERVVARAAGRVPVVAGTGSNSTREALRLTVHAAEVGADGVLVVCPYYNRPSQRMLLDHFTRVAEASPRPVVVYNIPGRTGVNLEPETLAELCRRSGNVAAVKEAAGSLEQVCRIRELCAVAILSGDDALTVPMMAVGATGVVSVASNVVPERVLHCVRAAARGDFAEARRLHEELLPLFRALFREPNPVPVKAALRLLGRDVGPPRRPLLPALPETEERLRQLLG